MHVEQADALETAGLSEQAMSQENVNVAEATLRAINRDDWDGALEMTAPDFELDLSRAVGIDRGIYDAARWRRLAEEFAGNWESVTYGADEFIDAGEHVVTPFTNYLRGRDGIEVQARGAWLWTFRDGVIARACLYQELDEALEAAGLRE